MTATVKPLADAVRLEVEGAAPEGTVANLVRNPDGALGGWGWVTPVPASTMTGIVGADHETYLNYRAAAGTLSEDFYTEALPVGPTQFVKAYWTVSADDSTAALRYRVVVDWLADDGTLLVSSTPTGFLDPTPTAPRSWGPFSPPTHTGVITHARLRFTIRNGTGSTPIANTSHLAMRDVKVAAADTEDDANLPVALPDDLYVNVLGTTHDLTITRERLNVGTLSANIVDADLDPAVSTTIRPGRLVRVTAWDGVYWQPVFSGRITGASVAYALTEPREARRARIDLNAVDNAQALANTTSTEGVLRIDQLPYVLEGVSPSVPWNANGSGSQAANVDIVETSDSSSALDQVTITRDSSLGYAWVDRAGVVQAWDRDLMPTSPALADLDEDTYADVTVGYDTDNAVNEVLVTDNEYDAVDESNTVATYGPYRDETSIGTWGVHRAEYRTHGLDYLSDAATYAAAVLAANAQPVRQLTAMRLRVDLTADWSTVDSDYAFVDLYDLVTVTCERAALDHAPARVVAIQHTISGPESKWMTTLGFAAPAGLAAGTMAARDVGETWPVELPTVAAGQTVAVSGGGGGGGGGAPTGPAGGDLTGSYPNPQIGPSTVGATEIADGNVGTAELADGAVTSAKILNGTIVNADLADGAVDSAKIADGSIGTTDLSLATRNYIESQAVDVDDEGTRIVTNALSLDFVGNGVTVTETPAASGKARVTIPGGSSGRLQVRVAVTSNVNLADPGTNSWDGITVAGNDRMLLAGQTNKAENGIYRFATPMTRVTDADTAAEIAAAEVAVTEGVTLGGSHWFTTFKASDTLDTTPMLWRQFEPTDLIPVRASSGTNALTLSGLQTVDGVALVAGNRVLVRWQGSAAANGVYVVSAGAWTRATDADTAYKIRRGMSVRVLEGTLERYKTFTQTMVVTTLGTDANQWRVLTYVDAGGGFDYPTPQGDGHVFINRNNRTLAGWNGTAWQDLTGRIICTSTTRPGLGTGDGVVIYETDTGLAWIMSGGVWVPFGSASAVPGNTYAIRDTLDSNFSIVATTLGAAAQIPGFAVTVVATGPSQVWLVELSCYFGITAGGTAIADLTVDGVQQNANGSVVGGNTGAGPQTAAKVYTVTGLSAGSHTFGAKAWYQGPAGSIVGGTNSSITAWTNGADPAIAAGFRSAAAQTLTNGTVTTVALVGTDHNVGAGVSIAGNIATVAVAGVYDISAHATFDGVGAAGRRLIMVETWTGTDPGVGAATQLARAENTPGGTAVASLCIADQAQLAAGAKVRLLAYQLSGGAMNLLNNPLPRLNLSRVDGGRGAAGGGGGGGTGAPAWRDLGIGGPYAIPFGGGLIPLALNYGGLNLNTDGAGRIVVVTAGTYFVTLDVTVASITASSTWYITTIKHRRSGVDQSVRDVVSTIQFNGAFELMTVSGHFDAIAGDTFEAWIAPQNPSAGNVDTGRAHFNAHKLGGI